MDRASGGKAAGNGAKAVGFLESGEAEEWVPAALDHRDKAASERTAGETDGALGDIKAERSAGANELEDSEIDGRIVLTVSRGLVERTGFCGALPIERSVSRRTGTQFTPRSFKVSR